MLIINRKVELKQLLSMGWERVGDGYELNIDKADHIVRLFANKETRQVVLYVTNDHTANRYIDETYDIEAIIDLYKLGIIEEVRI